jgi:hypothetical protein
LKKQVHMEEEPEFASERYVLQLPLLNFEMPC